MFFLKAPSMHYAYYNIIFIFDLENVLSQIIIIIIQLPFKPFKVV